MSGIVAMTFSNVGDMAIAAAWTLTGPHAIPSKTTKQRNRRSDRMNIREC